ncbi:hypothetical protein Ancab_038826 [Ancistrocladus abbreviatus]
MWRDYDAGDSEFAAAIAAAAYAIHSLEETRAEYQKKMMESFQTPPNRTRSGREDNITAAPDLGRLSRRISGNETRDPGIVPIRINARQVEGEGEQRGSGRVESKAEAWERAQMAKLNKWYDKTNSKILAWETDKKMRAKLQMEERQAEVERLKTLNLLHYQNKTAWVDDVAGGARKQLDEKRRKEEISVKEKAKKIRSMGRVPVNCFCFQCHR